MGAAALTRIAADDSGFSCRVDLLAKCAGGAVGILAIRLWNVPILKLTSRSGIWQPEH